MLIDFSKDNLLGIVFMIIAGFMVYGANFIVATIFRYEKKDSIKHIIIMKLAGILVAIIGMLKIFEII